jgi:galactose mutarotase-like enzyme
MMVVNEDRETMWYQMGWHPGFKTPFVYGKGSKSDVRLLLPEGMYTMYECNRDSFLTGKSERKQLGGAFPFTEEGLDYTYVFDMKEIPDRWAALYDPQSNIRVMLAFSDLPHLGVWSNSGAPFICLEPWQGCDDFAAPTPFEKKFGIVSLDPGQSDLRSVLLSVSS